MQGSERGDEGGKSHHRDREGMDKTERRSASYADAAQG